MDTKEAVRRVIERESSLWFVAGPDRWYDFATHMERKLAPLLAASEGVRSRACFTKEAKAYDDAITALRKEADAANE